MQVHKIIELLQGLTVEKRLSSKFSEILISNLFDAEKFEFDFGEFPNECKSLEEFDELVKQTKLPFPLCYFEIPSFGSILAFLPSSESRCMNFQVFYKKMSNEWSVLNPSHSLVVDLHTGLIHTCSKDPHIQELYSEEDNPENELMFTILNLVIRGVSVLNCSNVICLDTEPSKALNKKRIKNNKVPLFSYKTLHVQTQETRSKSEYQGGTHASPRLHLRRGHVRKYSTHSVWICDMVVGDPHKGIVLKDYKVT